MKIIVVFLLALSLLVLPPAADAAASTSVLAPPSEKIAGRSQADWSRSWWEWAASFDDDESPVADTQGDRCHLKQSGAVWFLAGTYGTRRTIRTCTVPAGKYLFFPLINYVVYPRPGYSLTCEDATDTAAASMEGASSLVLEVDGKLFKNLEGHRQATRECFDLAAQAGGGLMPSAANGFYIMLRPLRRGTHTINFGGILPDMSQAVTYTLHVE